jgi:2-dehydro-3-deoxyphosphogluconate aldolase/(4S)-4-hydroxy-2-oxoglutarate aldolase
MSRKDAFSRVKQVGIIPAIRSSNPAEAVHAAEAIRLGGIPVIEVSMGPPEAMKVLAAVVEAHGKHMLIGAGTVVDGQGVRLAASAGAQFIVTPGFSADAVQTAGELDVAIFVGALTPTEVQVASASGADAVKLFPCYAMGGPRYVKSLKGQYPHTDLIASGGVGIDTCAEYFRAGACAIGVGGEIADAESMAAGGHRVFTVRAKRLRETVRDAQMLRDGAGSVNREGEYRG